MRFRFGPRSEASCFDSFPQETFLPAARAMPNSFDFHQNTFWQSVVVVVFTSISKKWCELSQLTILTVLAGGRLAQLIVDFWCCRGLSIRGKLSRPSFRDKFVWAIFGSPSECPTIDRACRSSANWSGTSHGTGGLRSVTSHVEKPASRESVVDCQFGPTAEVHGNCHRGGGRASPSFGPDQPSPPPERRAESWYK